MGNTPKPPLKFYTGADVDVNNPDADGKVGGLKGQEPEKAPEKKAASKKAADKK